MAGPDGSRLVPATTAIGVGGARLGLWDACPLALVTASPWVARVLEEYRALKRLGLPVSRDTLALRQSLVVVDEEVDQMRLVERDRERAERGLS